MVLERKAAIFLWVLAWAGGCGGARSAVHAPDERGLTDSRDHGGRATPQSGTDEQLLSRVGELPADRAVTVGDKKYIVGPTYSAASGRTCRYVSELGKRDSPAHRQLACTEGGGWFFAPDVFGTR